MFCSLETTEIPTRWQCPVRQQRCPGAHGGLTRTRSRVSSLAGGTIRARAAGLEVVRMAEKRLGKRTGRSRIRRHPGVVDVQI